MVERLVILAAVAVLIAAGWGLVRLWQAWRLRRLQGTAVLAGVAPVGRPAVVAFSTPGCSECRIRQAPALERLAGQVGDAVTVRMLSAVDHADLARQVGVLTVPATVVVDARGTIRHLNLGYRSEQALIAQLQEASVA